MYARLPAVAAAVLVCLLLVGASVGAAATAGGGVAPADAAAAAPAQVAAPADETGTDDGTTGANATNGTELAAPVPVVDHEDPRTALGRGSARAVGSYLTASMSNRLAGSARLLDAGEYPEARAALGPEYDSLFDRYDDVRSDLGVGPAAADRFDVVRDEQVRYVTAVQTYYLVREDYLEARRDADSFRSRKLAREMELGAETVVESRDYLVANYTLLTEMPGDQRNETVRLLTLQAAEVTAVQSTVRDEEFVDTRLRIRVPNTTGSFGYPYRLQATVTTADGVPLSNTSGQLLVGAQRFPVETDRNGTLAVDYRPTSVADGATTVEARFFVDEQSQYLGDRTTVDLFVRQETPTVSVGVEPGTVGFGEEFVVSGAVGATAPNATTLGERTLDVNQYRDRLALAVADEARAAAVDDRAPPTAATVTVDASDLGTVDAAELRTTVDVASLTTVSGPVSDPANLTVTVDEAALSALPLPAALRTPLPTEFVGAGNVTLLVAIDDVRLGTVETGPDGRFEAVTPLPLAVREGVRPIGVSHVATDRALAPAAATTNVTVRATPTRTSLDEVTTRGRDLLLGGLVTTAGGDPLASQPVEIRIDGTVVGTVRSADDGTFGASLSLPDATDSRASVRVVAAFSAPTTSLGPSESDAATVALPEPRAAAAEEVPVVARLRETLGIGGSVVVLPVVEFGLSPGLVAGAVGAVVLLAGALVVARRRRSGPATAAGRRHVDDVAADRLLARGRPDPTDPTDETPPAVYLGAAREALSASNPRLATEYAYVAVRRHLSADATLPVRVTHREFLQAVRARAEETGDVADVVASLTAAYERAAFSPRGVPPDEAERAVAAAERAVGGR